GVRLSSQTGAEDEEIAASAEAGKRPDDGDVAGLEDEQNGGLAEGRLGLLDFQFDDGRSKPTQGGLLADHGKAFLEPAHGLVTFADVVLRADGEPSDDEDNDEDEDQQVGRHAGRAGDPANLFAAGAAVSGS